RRYFRIVKRTSPGTDPSTPLAPEFGVKRKVICRFFSPPLPSSTFHDFVNKGKIIPIKDIRGFYKLNESLKRLGLREVYSLPTEAKRSLEDVTRLALTLIDPLVFPAPSWLLGVEIMEERD